MDGCHGRGVHLYYEESCLGHSGKTIGEVSCEF
jgi:hypothetical protein